MVADNFPLTLGGALPFCVGERIELFPLGTADDLALLFVLAGVVKSLEGRASPAASVAFALIGRGIIREN